MELAMPFFDSAIRLIILLGILIFIHELGHFLLAKLVGIRVERFSLGFPPRAFGKKIGDTDYCISYVPLGGYVKLAGMIDESMDKDAIKGEPWEFMSKPIYQRFLVILAGPVMNILLAIVLFGALAYWIGIKEPMGVTVGKISSPQVSSVTQLQTGDMIVSINGQQLRTWDEVESLRRGQPMLEVVVERAGQTYTTRFAPMYLDSLERSFPPIVGGLEPNYPASKAGLQIGDRIVTINGQPIRTWTELTEFIHPRAGQKIVVEWQRNGERFSAEMEPIASSDPQQKQAIGKIGISFPIQEKEISLIQAVAYGFEYSWYVTKVIGHSIKLIFTGKIAIKEAFAGPVMIAKMASESAREGESNFIALIALISLNLGLINLLPIPVLDGGHLVFLTIEAIIRKPISPRVKLVVQQIGMVLIIALMLFVIANDIRRIL